MCCLYLTAMQRCAAAASYPRCADTVQTRRCPACEVWHQVVPTQDFHLPLQINRDVAAKPMGTEPACPMFSWIKNHETMDILIPDGEFFKHQYVPLADLCSLCIHFVHNLGTLGRLGASGECYHV